nr:retrovirus-related Pol polyprotein from transposon TNT 1-94 [Tanacetum cinerariifolium]
QKTNQDWLHKVIVRKKELTIMKTFKPVERMEAIRIFLAFATYMNFIVFQMDVKSANLNGKVKEEVYVKQPPGFEISEFPDYVFKLDKALYGLKQALRFEKLMTKKFEMSMIGDFIYFLGLQIKQDDKGISICQKQYTRSLLKKYKISDSSSVKTPMVPPNKLGPDLAGKPAVAMSSAEADNVAATGCYVSILWMNSQLSDYDILYKMVPIFCDNTNAIAISNNPVLHSRTKHIDIRKFQLSIKCLSLQANLQVLNELPIEKGLYKMSLSPLSKLPQRVLPVTLDFKTFTASTGLDYNNGEYVAHASLVADKAELLK